MAEGFAVRIIDLAAGALEQVPCNFLPDRPGSCRACLRWESPPAFMHGRTAKELPDRRQWYAQVFKEFGPCGKLAYEDNVLVGWIRYASAIFFEEAFNFYKYPVPPYPDIPFIACLLVAPARRGQGIGTALLEAAVEDLKARRFNGLETVASRPGQAELLPSGPIDFYLHRGFFVRREDPVLPLLRRQF